MRKIPLVLLAVSLAACQGKEKAEEKPAGAAPGKAAAAKADDGSIPKNLEIPYQVLFQCRIEMAQKEGTTYVPNPETSREVRDAVAKNPGAGDDCMRKLRGGTAAASSDAKAPAEASTAKAK